MKKAGKLLERATRLDPNRPEAYYDLSVCYMASNNKAKELQMQERAIQLWALVATTGMLGDKMIDSEDHPRWAADNWAMCVIATGYSYIAKDLRDHPKPFWFKNDDLLKLMLKEAEKARAAGGIHGPSGELMLLQAFTLSGIIRDGVFQTSAGFGRSTSKELALASQLFMQAVQTLGNKLSEEERHLYHSHVETCTSAAKQSLGLGERENEPIVGSWVLVKGLQSAIGALLNDKIGCIIGRKNADGRLPVEVIDEQGSRTHKLIRPANVNTCPLKDQAIALLASMEERERWSWVRNIFSRHHEMFCIPVAAGSSPDKDPGRESFWSWTGLKSSLEAVASGLGAAANTPIKGGAGVGYN